MPNRHGPVRLALATGAIALSTVAVTFHAGQTRLRTPVEVLQGRRVTPVWTLEPCGLPRCGLRIEESDRRDTRSCWPPSPGRPARRTRCWPSPSIPKSHFMSGRRSAVRFYNSALGIHTDKELQQVVDTLTGNPPKLVALRPNHKFYTEASRTLMTLVRARYTRLETIGGLELGTAGHDLGTRLQRRTSESAHRAGADPGGSPGLGESGPGCSASVNCHTERTCRQEYLMAKALAHGADPYQPIPELARQWLPAYEGQPAADFPHPAPYSIVVGWLSLPLAAFTYRQAVDVWLAFEAVCLCGAVALWFRLRARPIAAPSRHSHQLLPVRVLSARAGSGYRPAFLVYAPAVPGRLAGAAERSGRHGWDFIWALWSC